MNPDYKPCCYSDIIKEKMLWKKEKLKQSQMYKRSNQTHPAFRRR